MVFKKIMALSVENNFEKFDKVWELKLRVFDNVTIRYSKNALRFFDRN